MNLFLGILILLSVASLVFGQVFLKHAVNFTHEHPIPWKKCLRMFAAGIGLMTLWFLLWLGLLQKLDLSFVYPFEALSAIFVCLAASMMLKERMSLRLWAGVALICLGVILVSLS